MVLSYADGKEFHIDNVEVKKVLQSGDANVNFRLVQNIDGVETATEYTTQCNVQELYEMLDGASYTDADGVTVQEIKNAYFNHLNEKVLENAANVSSSIRDKLNNFESTVEGYINDVQTSDVKSKLSSLSDIASEEAEKIQSYDRNVQNAVSSAASSARTLSETASVKKTEILDKATEVSKSLSDLQKSANESSSKIDVSELYASVAKKVAAAVVAEHLSKEATDTYVQAMALSSKMSDVMSYIENLDENTRVLDASISKISDVVNTSVNSLGDALNKEHTSFINDANNLITQVNKAVQANVDLATQATDNQLLAIEKNRQIAEVSDKVNVICTAISVILSLVSIALFIYKEKKDHGKQ